MNKNCGFTLIELMLTVTISSMVMVYAMIVFTDIEKGFRFLASQNDSVQKMIVKKKQIDNCLSGINIVDSWTSTTLRFRKSGSDTLFNIHAQNGSLVADNHVICEEVKNFKFDLIEDNDLNPKPNNSKVLLWECLSEKDGFICGAVSIRE